MTEIAIYLEGGGNTTQEKAELRQGFEGLFRAEKLFSREKHLSLRFVPCGGRKEAHDAFTNALNSNPERVNALLVDSEVAIALVSTDRPHDAEVRVAHLRNRQGSGDPQEGDGWTLPNVRPERIHLMVQCMEAWIVSDPEALKDFYKQNFKPNRLPARPNLEEEPKSDIYSKLDAATRDTQKGTYRKIKHASELLQLIHPDKVARRCPRFAIFRDWLKERLGH